MFQIANVFFPYTKTFKKNSLIGVKSAFKGSNDIFYKKNMAYK